MEHGLEQWMRAQNIAVKSDWLRACVTWIQEEEGRTFGEGHLQNLVFQQWLHADIRDSCMGCLPPALYQTPVGVLNGHFVVQIDSSINVGSSAYSQLMKIKGQELEESEQKNTFEAKPTRMLLLELTDGYERCQGMEYQSIQQLNTDMPPGTKVVLQGTIRYRLGVLLLDGSHVTVLGGAVDHLMEENSQKRVLAREINRDDLAGTTPNIDSTHPSGQNVINNNTDNNFDDNKETILPDTILIPLCDVPDMWQYCHIIFVKATIKKLDGDLRHTGGVWSLNGIIADGTGELPVLLSNQILEKLIGFSAQHFLETIEPNPQHKQEGIEGLRRCRHILSTIHCVMELQWSDVRPIVTRLLDV